MTSVKDRVWLALSGRPGEYQSGEELARNMQVSRAAVWKAVRELIREGNAIQAVPRQGYRLVKPVNQLRSAEIQALLKAQGEEDIAVCCYPTIDSTNTEARRQAQTFSTPAVFAAEEQTAGRGRQGHSFYSPQGSGLYMTVLTPLSLPLKDAALMTQAMAVAALRAVKEAGGPELSVKWVNDLFYQGKKTAGILTEAISDLETGNAAVLICGIGLNLTTRTFPGDIAQTAGSLGGLDKNLLCALITARFLSFARQLPDPSPWITEYRAHSMVLGKGVTFTQNGVPCRAVAENIDDRGGLIVRLKDGSRRTLSSGEISIVPDSLI